MTDSVAISPHDPAAPPRLDADDTARNRLVIGILVVSTFVVVLNETVMSVALPTLMVDLGITAATAQWLTTGFLLTMAVVIPVTGYLMQRFHTRPIYLLAMSLFTAGTLLAALAPGFGVLLLARVVQASGTAIMIPLLMTTAMSLVPAHARGRTMGTISVVIAVAPAIGPTISGLVLSVLSWRFMFVVVLPVAVVALVVGAKKMVDVTTPREVDLDVPSVVLSALGFGGLVYGLSALGEGASEGQVVDPALPAGVGVVALVLFVLRQVRLARTGSPLLDLRTFATKNFTFSIVLIALASLVLFGSLVLLPIYTQNVLGLGTLETGLLLLPGGLAMGLLSPVVGRLYDALGPRPLLPVGATLISVALWLMSLLLHEDTSIAMIVVVHVLLNIGLAFTFTPLFSASLGSLEPALYSHGSAVLNTVQQVMGAVGTALFITVMAAAEHTAAAGGADERATTAAGVHLAFLVGASISLVGVAASLLVRRPETDESAPLPMAH
ncbi:DHA2 family efflux MFS transporter permease subunit [Janibacter melonis]|uniref:DHA2 family efflux MFS transporter permease subunit n=1 Tax=Janibacter melonis TaxID=262209 RepID=UPI00191B204F|nr:DHA2 family efflux MFS transporter permease subunit [Janibacter melonis]